MGETPCKEGPREGLVLLPGRPAGRAQLLNAPKYSARCVPPQHMCAHPTPPHTHTSQGAEPQHYTHNLRYASWPCTRASG